MPPFDPTIFVCSSQLRVEDSNGEKGINTGSRRGMPTGEPAIVQNLTPALEQAEQASSEARRLRDRPLVMADLEELLSITDLSISGANLAIAAKGCWVAFPALWSLAYPVERHFPLRHSLPLKSSTKTVQRGGVVCQCTQYKRFLAASMRVPHRPPRPYSKTAKNQQISPVNTWGSGTISMGFRGRRMDWAMLRRCRPCSLCYETQIPYSVLWCAGGDRTKQ